MPAFPIVDSHVHFYDPGNLSYPGCRPSHNSISGICQPSTGLWPGLQTRNGASSIATMRSGSIACDELNCRDYQGDVFGFRGRRGSAAPGPH
jgi:hypothetical protein